MARDSRITRTVRGWNVEVMVAYTDSMTIKTEVIPYTGNATEDAKILKDMKKALQAENMELLKIVSKEETQQLYAMSESEFMRNAKQIENRFDAI